MKNSKLQNFKKIREANVTGKFQALKKNQDLKSGEKSTKVEV
jgi:hypothetical protein